MKLLKQLKKEECYINGSYLRLEEGWYERTVKGFEYIVETELSEFLEFEFKKKMSKEIEKPLKDWSKVLSNYF